MSAAVLPAALRRRVNGAVPYWLIALAVIVLIAVTADVVAGGMLTWIDHRISRVMRGWGIRDTSVSKGFVYAFTQFGQRGTVLAISLPFIVWLSWSRRTSEPLVRYAVALVSLMVAVYAAKYAVARSAPPVDAVGTAQGMSFPSGHLANAVLVWGLLAWASVRWATDARIMRATRIVQVVAPISVAVSMTLLDYHWLSDYIAGAALGVLLLAWTLAPGWAVLAGMLDRRVTGRLARSGSR